MSSQISLLFLAIVLVFLNGFFVAAEFGLVKLRQTRVRAIAKAHGFRGRILAKVHSNLDAYLSACQLGITLASLGLGWVGEPAFARLLEPVFSALGVEREKLIHGISFFVAFFIISYLHIVVGELAPKSMAIRRAEIVGLWTAAPLYGFYWAMYPAIWALNTSANWILKLVRLDATVSHDTHYSADELKLILRGSEESDQFTNEEWRVLAQALDFRELDVADLMRPVSEMVALHATDGVEKNLDRMVQTRYSRYPYIGKDGKVMGVLHLKDVFFALNKGEAGSNLDALVRPAQLVSPSMSAMELFRRFREGAPHFAVVTYQDGEPLGFVTLDNLLSAQVGEIRDEFRHTQNEWTRLDDGSLIGKGSLPIFTLERALGVDIDQDDVDTVGGLLMWRLGDLPKEGDRITFDEFDVVVKRMKGPRIVMVRVYPRLANAA
ncbi:CBS domain containing-hemolysin-like protein [Chitinivorax tropicus]|uniref:CBS domain containing-hemolysin-like protein n=1 Tax=Chitinivorax tropicus TaxID=714531 RepID=A0A840MG87_9PROT|nr:hemolysin family protein [Chitinivorax tropicus]MBB5017668.1 CBS domain containing-hemolysin-like protein [Chitinivorax tropicus]